MEFTLLQNMNALIESYFNKMKLQDMLFNVM